MKQKTEKIKKDLNSILQLSFEQYDLDTNEGRDKLLSDLTFYILDYCKEIKK